ncbi:MAG: carbohydrate kinase [Dictyoglomus sp. NZ13-RE01]|nr:MAG: carbohydrate kinase [Dictyoglomus sp. NZ13-RE01]
MRNLVLGIDIGTTGVKAILINEEGSIVWESYRPCDLISIKPGFAEEDPIKWWNNVVSILEELKSTNYRDKVGAIGVSGMVPTLILLDKEGNPIRYSIQQNDARAVSEIEYFKKIIDEEKYFEVTGNTINQQVIFPKFLWLKKNEPENVAKARYIMGSYDFISYKLTGVIHTELNWALESGLWEIKERRWYKEILEKAEIPEEMLPPVYEPIQIIGETKDIIPGIPVIAGSADHIASALGMGLREEGDLLLKIGGAGDILFVIDRLTIDKRLFIDYHDIPSKFVLNGCMASSGSIVKWFKNNFVKELSYDDLTSLAENSSIGSNGLILLPYFLGEKTPIFDPIARGVILGLGLHHNIGDIFRAILEGVAYGFLHHVEVIKELSFSVKRVFISNGGAKNTLWRQIIVDVIGKDAIYIENHPGSSLGAAFIAGKAIGLFKDWKDIDLFLKESKKVIYNPENHEKYKEFYKIYRDLYPILKPFYQKLYQISGGK